MTVYRGTLCGSRDCQNVATHFVRLLVPSHGVPFDKRVPMDVLISAEVCEAHADKTAFADDIKSADLVGLVQRVCQARGMPPVDMRHAVVRLVRKDDGDFYQYPSR